MLDGWRKSRSHLVPTLELTPNNRSYSMLRAELDVMREQRIRQGERTFQFNSDRLRQDSSRAFSQGRVKAQFNHSH